MNISGKSACFMMRMEIVMLGRGMDDDGSIPMLLIS
jgi:hypothetical protein